MKQEVKHVALKLHLPLQQNLGTKYKFAATALNVHRVG